MTFLLLSLTLCLSVDGVDLGPVTLTDPPVIRADAGGATLTLSRWDRAMLQTELRRVLAEGRVRFTMEHLDEILGFYRLVDPTTEALRCGECVAGGLFRWECVPGKKGSPCLSCRVCADPLPEPIAEVRR